MANQIRFNKAFLELGLEFDSDSWTLDELNSLLLTRFVDDDVPDIENLIDLSQRLGCKPTDKVLTTYVNKNDKSVKFSVPRIHLNSEGVLSLFIGSTINFPLVYTDSKSKTYTVGDLVFKVQPYRKEGEKKVVAINFVTTVTKSIDDYDEDFEISLGVLAKSEVDLGEVVKALQNNTPLPENSLVQIGVGGGGYATALKPWMLPVGDYKITSAVEKSITKKDGTQATLLEGYVSPVVNGITDESQSHFVAMGGNPFTPGLTKAAISGAAVYASINGGYQYDKNVATIGYATRLTPESDGSVNATRWQAYQMAAKRSFISTRRMNSAKLFTAEQLFEKKVAYLEEKGSTVTEQPKALATVAATDKPEKDEVPF